MSLMEILSKIMKGPDEVHDTSDGAAIVALSLHCLMIKAGYQVTPSTGHSSTAPPSDWNSKYSNEWVFEYSRKGFEGVFVLHCSLAASTGKMFVRGRERDNPKNMHNLGLQVDKYVADTAKLQSGSWEGILTSESVLEEMFQEYISTPLTAQAIPQPTMRYGTAFERGRAWLQHSIEDTSQRDLLIPISIGVASLGIAAICIYIYRQRSSVT